MTIYELLAQRQTELEEREKELLIVVKELEGVQQELHDVRAMTNIRLLEPASDAPVSGTDTAEPASNPEVEEAKSRVDVSDLLLQKEEWEAKYGVRV